RAAQVNRLVGVVRLRRRLRGRRWRGRGRRGRCRGGRGRDHRGRGGRGRHPGRARARAPGPGGGGGPGARPCAPRGPGGGAARGRWPVGVRLRPAVADGASIDVVACASVLTRCSPPPPEHALAIATTAVVASTTTIGRRVPAVRTSAIVRRSGGTCETARLR